MVAVKRPLSSRVSRLVLPCPARHSLSSLRKCSARACSFVESARRAAASSCAQTASSCSPLASSEGDRLLARLALLHRHPRTFSPRSGLEMLSPARGYARTGVLVTGSRDRAHSSSLGPSVRGVHSPRARRSRAMYATDPWGSDAPRSGGVREAGAAFQRGHHVDAVAGTALAFAQRSCLPSCMLQGSRGKSAHRGSPPRATRSCMLMRERAKTTGGRAWRTTRGSPGPDLGARTDARLRPSTRHEFRSPRSAGAVAGRLHTSLSPGPHERHLVHALVSERPDHSPGKPRYNESLQQVALRSQGIDLPCLQLSHLALASCSRSSRDTT